MQSLLVDMGQTNPLNLVSSDCKEFLLLTVYFSSDDYVDKIHKLRDYLKELQNLPAYWQSGNDVKSLLNG